MNEGLAIIIPHIIFLFIDIIVMCSAMFHRIQKFAQGEFVAFAICAILLHVVTLAYLADVHSFVCLPLGWLQFSYLSAWFLMTFAAYHWMLFTVSILKEWITLHHIWHYIFALPVIISLFIVLANPFTGWVLTLDLDHAYHRGSLFYIQLLCPYAYMVFSFIVLIVLSRQANKTHALKMLAIFLSFFVPVVLCTILQIGFYSGAYPQISISIAVVMTYIEQYSIQVSRIKRFNELEAINKKLELSVSKQETQIEEIRQLNTQLEENQARLEESSAEQEAQIEEIQSLNSQLNSNNAELQKINDQITRQLEVIGSLSQSYICIYYLDIASEQFMELSPTENTDIREYIGQEGNARQKFVEMSKHLVIPEYEQYILDATNIDTLPQRLKDKDVIEFEFYAPNARWCMAAFICAGRDEEGNCTHVLFSVRSINDQKDQEENYRRNLKKLNNMLEASGIGTWQLIEQEGRHTRMITDDKMKALMGIPSGSNITDEEAFDMLVNRIHPDDVAAFAKYDEELHQGVSSEITYRWEHPTLGLRYNRCGGGSVQVQDGLILSGYHRDVTDLVLKEKELEYSIAANQAKSKFLQNMSHEIRTPINAMFGFAQLLGLPDGMWSEEEKTQYNEHIYNSYNMIEMLINDILDSAASENGDYRMEYSEVDVNSVCRAALSTVEFRRPAAVEMKFSSDLSEGYTIQSDGRRIQQVLINYLTNACKFTRKGSIHLHCSATENPGKLTLSVTDTGVGVPIEKSEEIFGRFTKLDEHVQGSGLGLNICHTIATKLGGRVFLDTGYTGGARFVFVIDNIPNKE